MRYVDKYEEMEFHLNQMEECFRNGDKNYIHSFNAFLASSHSVIFCLNKEFNSRVMYDNWKNKRSSRLPEIAKTFRNLRNISEKEGPVKNTGVIANFDFGGAGIVIPPHAEVVTPWIDTYTGKLNSKKATITTKEGVATEVEPLIVHDYVVVVKSHGKTYKLDKVIIDSREYAKAIRQEIDKTEKKYRKQTEA